jgi:hypothetical protein
VVPKPLFGSACYENWHDKLTFPWPISIHYRHTLSPSCSAAQKDFASLPTLAYHL